MQLKRRRPPGYQHLQISLKKFHAFAVLALFVVRRILPLV